MISTLHDGSRRDPLVVLRDGHVIYVHGYAGAGPMLECVELLGHHLIGTCVCTSVIDVDCARLLVFAGVDRVEVDAITPLALQVLANAGVDILARGVAELGPEDPGDPLEGVADFFCRLRTSTGYMGLGRVT